MTDLRDQGSLFLAASNPHVDEPERPAVDDSNEAMDRLRHPFDVDRTAAPGGSQDHGEDERG